MHPRTSTSRCSQREQRRRNLCKRRHTRAIAVRRVSSTRADAQGPTRVRRPTGSSPRAAAGGRGLAPSSARSLGSAGRSGGGPRRFSHCRPSGAAGAGPGESAKARAVRASAVPRCLLVVVQPPRDRPRDRVPFFRAPVPAGGTLTRGRSSDRASGLRRTICSRLHEARIPSRGRRFSTSGSSGCRGGAKCQTGPVTRAIYRYARPQTRWR